MLSLSRSLCSLCFSLLKTKNINHYALIFFSFHIFFFLSLNHFFFTNIYFFISLRSHFFFNLAYIFFSVSTSLFNNFFFIMLSLCSHASIFYIFSFFISVSGGTLTDISFLQLFQLQHQLFQMNNSHSFYYLL